MKFILAIFALATLAVASPLDIYLHIGSDMVQSGLHTQGLCRAMCAYRQPTICQEDEASNTYMKYPFPAFYLTSALSARLQLTSFAVRL